MNNANLNPIRLAPGAAPIDLAGLVAAIAAIQPQLQTQLNPGASTGLPQMQMHAGTAVPVAWPGQYWQQPQPHAHAPAMGPGMPPLQGGVAQPWFPQLLVPGPAQSPDQNAQSVLASIVSMLQTYHAQHSQQVAQQSPRPRPQSGPTPPSEARTHAPKSVPVATKVDDARIIEALTGGRARGITIRQALESLDGVNDHSTSAWKDYFIDNLDKFYITLPRSGVRAFLIAKDNAPPPVLKLPRRSNAMVNAACTPEQNAPAATTPALPRTETHAAADDVASGNRAAFGSRRTRGEPVILFHAGTRIPPGSSGRKKPAPPVPEDEDSAGTRVGSHKFTHSDHIFFIHYLRWRLFDNPRVSKRSIFEGLAEQTPNHDAEAWRRHWDKFPELPDQIYIELAQRDNTSFDHSATSATDSSLTSLEEDSSNECNPDSGTEDRSTSSDQQVRPPGGRSITEEDVRAMARYRLEKAKEWSVRTNRKGFWRDFAMRPENAAKRSWDAWARAESTHSQKLHLYYQEYEMAQESTGSLPSPAAQAPTLQTWAPKSTAESPKEHQGSADKTGPQSGATQSLKKDGPADGSLEGEGKNLHSLQVQEVAMDTLGPQNPSRKRNAEAMGTGGGSGLVAHKRPKPEVIEVSD
ncbi:hypothetical protein OH77DRAFT_1522453 [Trametes cingulata]|nr:hypothetical protein OH77DRAFT_1522453 [Trametes cingulata]